MSGRSGPGERTRLRTIAPFLVFFALIVLTGTLQSWSLAFAILNLCLVSAVTTLGVNIQWGYAGLVNFGVMGFTALGGVAVVIVAGAPVRDAWRTGGAGVVLALLLVAAAVVVALAARRLVRGVAGGLVALVVVVVGFVAAGQVLGPSAALIEAVNPAEDGYLGGLGLPVLLAWVAGGILAAAAAWVIGKIALGLRADYLAIATLGVSEIVTAMLMNEDWLTRGVKNVVGLPRPVPYEVELRTEAWFAALSRTLGVGGVELSSLVVKLAYVGLFVAALGLLLWLSQRALNSPWGRMMRAVRDNETAAEAMGKDVKSLHLLVFVIGSGVIGLAGAMLTTLDGQFTPGAYQPLRYTFLIWVMVIVGGSGNNFGSTIGAFVIWYAWVEAEPVGAMLIDAATSMLPDTSPLRRSLIANAAQMRYVVMGLILLFTLRFAPRGLIPEADRRG